MKNPIVFAVMFAILGAFLYIASSYMDFYAPNWLRYVTQIATVFIFAYFVFYYIKNKKIKK
ncbi:hypothetical protein B1R32_103121 [Abditibacterium utsteinense]|uniref:Uncharacterized protein n=1 Tax=Abditibacterium utsteinense TaxID=1960156 RepID=A0A2S8SVP9_9BACT|nr:hypothetical protein B1R32_103121 [Abditibacterium utsteinense]